MPPRFERPAPELVELFDAHLAKTFGERKQMFGCPCGFVNGQMFCGLFGQRLFLRLSEADRRAFLGQEGAEVFDPMGGRPMREYVVAPPALLEDDAALGGWVAKAYGYAQALPPKQKKRPAPGAKAGKGKRASPRRR